MAAHSSNQYLNYGYVKINGDLVWHSAHGSLSITDLLGVTIIKVNPYSCSLVEEPRQFDTHWVPAHATALSNYLQQLDSGTIIVGVTADEPVYNLQDALSALNDMGADVSDVQWRGTFAFVAQKDFPDKTVLRKILTEGEVPQNGQMKMSARITDRLPNSRSVAGLLRKQTQRAWFKTWRHSVHAIEVTV